MKKATIFTLLLLLTLFETRAELIEYLLPQQVTDVKQPSLSLNGQWQFRYTPKGRWESITVPGEASMQGFAIEHDTPYMYRHFITVPKDYAGKRIILRFDGVYSYARLFVNGTYVRDHRGGFTRWEADVTDLVRCGSKNEIQVEVTDCLDDVSYGSAYAHHTIGGILRDVTLYALDRNVTLSNLAIETHLDEEFKDAVLKLTYNAATKVNATNQLKLLLKTEGRIVKEALFSLDSGVQNQEINIENPKKWDAEHPNLYTMELTLLSNGEACATYAKKVGFRHVEIKENRMLVNGKPVKLRGACRHDVHPTLGRTTDAYLDSMDVVLLKRSNQNFVRTSHYPPTERFVEFCDEMGVYVECETAICFINTHAQKNYAESRKAMHFDPDYSDAILNQLKEMVATHRTHPSILFWSIGNESTYGENFQRSYDWIKEEDTTRPAIFSYPGTVPAGIKCYDIASMHYQDVNGNLWQYGVRSYNYQVNGYPALFDEWAHVPCYTYSTLRDDPNIREFWGQSLDKMWSGTFNAQGGLGGAIWGYIDETFMLPKPKKGNAFWKEFAHTAKPEGFKGECVGYGEWGIIDVWRREKPEFWGTKKAYSPVRLETQVVSDFWEQMPLKLLVHNRFDHSNLNEIRVVYNYQGVDFEGVMPHVEPHAKGILVVPAQEWSRGKQVTAKFYDQKAELIDAYQVWLGAKKGSEKVVERKMALAVENSATHYTVKGDGFEIPFSKLTGLIDGATSNGGVVLTKGPFLHIDVNYNHLTGAEVRSKASNYMVKDAEWSLKRFALEQVTDETVDFIVEGNYQDVALNLRMQITSSGEITFYYQVDGEPNGYLREAGLNFVLPDNFETLQWERDGYWSYYPENDFAGNSGSAPLYNSHVPAYGDNPSQLWQLDTHNYYYWSDAGASCQRPLTQWAKGMKENIYQYTLSKGETALSAYSSDASIACRINKHEEGKIMFYINNRWDYPEIAWGDYCKAESLHPTVGVVRVKL
ncbi:MAG: glycoside hydrolase family 2 protein [Phocaeicola sp.]